ncbi:MAG: hypothetical protein CL862_00825 [Cyanobium sp. NAT70]|nr:hypothetical protein [Cyanobium sp. NAT70]
MAQKLPDTLKPVGTAGVEALGHREYVGGKFYEIGKLQFDFLVSMGMRPRSVLLDIACGCFRLGLWAIPFLKKGHYLGIELEESLVKAGFGHELSREMAQLKKPNVIVNGEFNFSLLNSKADFAIAQSLFTHLSQEDMIRCLKNCKTALNQDGKFYVTFFIGEQEQIYDESHAHSYTVVTHQLIKQLGRECGYQTNIIGDWGHPRGQQMVEFSLLA